MRGDAFQRGIAACRGPWPGLLERIAARLADEPRCPVAHYLAGCLALESSRRATGVWHLMAAHRVEPALESAALLVFAGLNWIEQPQRPLLPVLLDTWIEFRRPHFDRRSRERTLLDAFAAPREESAHCGALARRLWRLPIVGLRNEIRSVLAVPGDSLAALLSANS